MKDQSARCRKQVQSEVGLHRCLFKAIHKGKHRADLLVGVIEWTDRPFTVVRETSHEAASAATTKGA